MPVKFWHTSLRFWFFLSYLITTVWKDKLDYLKKKLHQIIFVFSFYEYQESLESWIKYEVPILLWLISVKCQCDQLESGHKEAREVESAICYDVKEIANGRRPSVLLRPYF